MVRQPISGAALSSEQLAGNRYVQVLAVASQAKAQTKPLQRPSLAEEFYRENPMPWLLDADPVDDPHQKQSA